MSQHDKKNDIITAGTSGKNDTHYDENGIVQNHAYTIIGLVKLSNGQRLVKCRNPWGVDTFKGNWSDESNLWTDELVKEAKHKKDLNDGVHLMTIEDYAREF